MDIKMDDNPKTAYRNYSNHSARQNILDYYKYIITAVVSTVGTLTYIMSKDGLHIGMSSILLTCLITIYTTVRILEKDYYKNFEKIVGILFYICFSFVCWIFMFMLHIEAGLTTYVFSAMADQFFNMIAIAFIQNPKIEVCLHIYYNFWILYKGYSNHIKKSKN